ncbi:IclR family transcriptional regulator [Mesorhizobium australicum]|uniref:Transcriptional regulator, IclR family n=1 Tax=Mesorhizobium australicum TaxID=536018 RepID=A0A1X7N2L2_9HYPH|nr:IclR family transcriptional regulator [Mesorhizobium australicum]SMH31456.1 transcriptional regulator, IclR family [Mesorhizobium australicum]
MTVELDKSVNQSTQMAFMIIEVMAEIGQPVGLSDLARRIGVSKVRVFRFLRTLLSLGYVLQDPQTEKYRLSYKLYHLGQALADSTDILREARPVMVELRDATGFTVSFSQMEHGGMRILDMVRTEQPVVIVTRPGALLDFHASAQGKIALAFGGAKLAATALRQWTSETSTDRSAVEAEVAEVRTRGWADAPNQTLQGVTAVSAPVFDMTGDFVATLTIAGPTNTIGTPPDPRYVEALTAAARKISRNLGNTDQMT